MKVQRAEIWLVNLEPTVGADPQDTPGCRGQFRRRRHAADSIGRAADGVEGPFCRQSLAREVASRPGERPGENLCG